MGSLQLSVQQGSAFLTQHKLLAFSALQILASGLYPEENTGQYLVGDTRAIIREAAKKVRRTWHEQGALH